MALYTGKIALFGKGEGYVEYSISRDVIYTVIDAKLADITMGSYYLVVMDRNSRIGYVNIGNRGKVRREVEHSNIFNFSDGLMCAIVHVANGIYDFVLSGGFRGQSRYRQAVDDFFLCSELYLGKAKVLQDIIDVKTNIDIIKEDKKSEERSKYKDKMSKIEAIFDKNIRDNFYDNIKSQLNDIFDKYEKEENLQRLIEGSKWAKIRYGKESEYYTVGVIYDSGKATYICYGVPTKSSNVTPKELDGYCEFLPLDRNRSLGYWMMYQNADNGELIQLSRR